MLKSSKRARVSARDTKKMQSILVGMREALEGLKVERIIVLGKIRYNGVGELRATCAAHKAGLRRSKMDIQILDDGRNWSVVLVSKKK